jgi:hypothetical protein
MISAKIPSSSCRLGIITSDCNRPGRIAKLVCIAPTDVFVESPSARGVLLKTLRVNIFAVVNKM